MEYRTPSSPKKERQQQGEADAEQYFTYHGKHGGKKFSTINKATAPATASAVNKWVNRLLVTKAAF